MCDKNFPFCFGCYIDYIKYLFFLLILYTNVSIIFLCVIPRRRLGITHKNSTSDILCDIILKILYIIQNERYNFMETHQRLRDLREDANLKQENIAQILGIKQQQYSEYERGKREMSIKNYIKIAKYYNVSLDYVAGLTNDKRKNW